MITTIFNAGKYPETEKDYVPLIGDTQEEQYSIALSLLIIAVVLIPVMLLVKPCFFSRAAENADAESEEIELANASESMRGSETS